MPGSILVHLIVAVCAAAGGREAAPADAPREDAQERQAQRARWVREARRGPRFARRNHITTTTTSMIHQMLVAGAACANDLTPTKKRARHRRHR